MALISLLLTTLLAYQSTKAQIPVGTGPIGGGVGGAGLGLGNGGLGLGGLPGGGTILDGSYQWISQNGRVFTLHVCSGLGFDRNLYAGIERQAINAFGLADGTLSFSNIIGRSNGLRLGADGAFATFNGFRVQPTFGIGNVVFTLIYARCDNLFQFQINDETYTLTKLTNIVLNPNQCWRPGQATFNQFGNIAQFQTTLPFLGNNIARLLTLRLNPQNNIWACNQNINLQTQALVNAGLSLGNVGPGQLLWGNRLLINAFTNPLNQFCPRGIELMLARTGGLWCNRICQNTPTVGLSGFFPQLPQLLPNFGLNSCAIPNLNNLVGFPQFTPGVIPQNPLLPFINNPLGAGLGAGLGVGLGAGIGLGGIGGVGALGGLGVGGINPVFPGALGGLGAVGGLGTVGGLGVGGLGAVGGLGGVTPVIPGTVAAGQLGSNIQPVTPVVNPLTGGVQPLPHPVSAVGVAPNGLGGASIVRQQGTATVVTSPQTVVVP